METSENLEGAKVSAKIPHRGTKPFRIASIRLFLKIPSVFGDLREFVSRPAAFQVMTNDSDLPEIAYDRRLR
jgi:hypothetical protein